jgi:mRNA interferase RelE/StbE
MLKSLLSASMRKGLQKSIELELYQANLWKSFANQLQRLGYFGSQKYFLEESAEELTHYQIIVDFMNDMGDCASLPEIEAMKDNLQGDVKQLKNFTPNYRLRVGNYRILFEVEEITKVIYRVKHRQNIYN